VSRPAVTSSGVVVFGRHPEVARAVWSRDVGFPGDGRYLDFHRDATGELSDEAVQPHLLPTGSRVPLRLRYHRVTDRHLPASAKQPYEPEAAEAATAEHAEQFLAGLSDQLEAQGARLGWSALAVAPFDAELFGHWWREGPRFIDALARRTAGRLTWTTPTRELEREEPVELLEPAPGTWGAGADFSVWVAPETGPLWTRILEAVSDLERRRPPRAPRAKRAYALLEREVDLAAASDWTFLIRMKTAVDYARARVETHLENAAVLRRMLDGGAYDLAKLAELEARGGPTG
jgi:1,4-alpha-glucan branching enzyme